MKNLSAPARAALARSGWSENYRADPARFEATYCSGGEPLPPTVRDFLSRFGDLYLVYPSPSFPDRSSVVHFDAWRATDRAQPLWVDYCSRRLKSPLCVIGSCDTEHSILLMDPAGKMYAGMDESLVLLGNSPAEALDTLLLGRRGEEIPPDDDS